MSVSNSENSNPELDRRIQDYLRAFALRMPDCERAGPFLASFDSGSDNPYRNYAVPDDDARPDLNDIAALTDIFRRRGRVPRLEYVAKAAPYVETALVEHGFAIEKRFPVLVCAPGAMRETQADGVTMGIAAAESAIVAAAEVGAIAYGGEAYAEPLRRLVSQGGVLMLARDRASGMAIGAGMATPPHNGTCEVAGIGVIPSHRRRGIAGALTAAITREAFLRDATLAWLTPGHDEAERIYARAGFVRAAEQLHISLPA
ncbi:MAG: GNAT family N-acetyltransferase [Rhizomicrobium sp.]|jgi:GNAT superfamily N-acetyltransferase